MNFRFGRTANSGFSAATWRVFWPVNCGKFSTIPPNSSCPSFTCFGRPRRPLHFDRRLCQLRRRGYRNGPGVHRRHQFRRGLGDYGLGASVSGFAIEARFFSGDSSSLFAYNFLAIDRKSPDQVGLSGFR